MPYLSFRWVCQYPHRLVSLRGGGRASLLTSVVRPPACLHAVISGKWCICFHVSSFFIRRCGGEGKEVVHVWYRGSERLRVKSVRAGLNNGRKCVSLRHGVGGPTSLLPVFSSSPVERKGRKCSGYYLFAFAFFSQTGVLRL